MRRLSAAISAATLLAVNAAAQTVKITGIGSHGGEFCRRDRTMLFEDPDSAHLLFYPGFTVAGAKDPRLGKINVVVLSSVHGDHLGSARIPNPRAGTCAKPKASVKMPNSNGIGPSFLSKEFTAQLKKDGLTAYVGPDNGYALTFSNGLVVYMSGDSGITIEFDSDARCVKGC